MAINDIIAGHVQVIFESLDSIAPHARSGKVKALAVSGARRSPGFPGLPTVAEAGGAREAEFGSQRRYPRADFRRSFRAGRR